MKPRKRSNFLRLGVLLLALTVVTTSVALTHCKYITWYGSVTSAGAAQNFYFVRAFSYTNAPLGESRYDNVCRPDLEPIPGTNIKGWWAFVMRGGDGGPGRDGGTWRVGGRGGGVIGCVYVGANEQLYGLAGRGGQCIGPNSATGSCSNNSWTDSWAFGGGFGRYGNSGSNDGTGSGGGASVLYRSTQGLSSYTPQGAGTTHANVSTELVAVAGGGGGGNSSNANNGEGGRAGSTRTRGAGNGWKGNNSNGGAGGTTTGGANAQSGAWNNAGFLQGASGVDGNNEDSSGGGSGYFGGGNGHDPTLYKSGGGGGSSILTANTGVYALESTATYPNNYAYARLNPYYVDNGSSTNGTQQSSGGGLGARYATNGFIYLVYMGDNDDSSTPIYRQYNY